MKILGRLRLDAFKRQHAGARASVDAWTTEVESARWAGPQDVKSRYPTASFLANNRIIFNIKGNSYRLVIQATYRNGLVLVEWVGTHAQYDKRRF